MIAAVLSGWPADGIESRVAAIGSAPAGAASSVDVPAAKLSSPESDWKLIAFASANYLDITKKWYERLTELGYNQHVVAAMDKQILDELVALGYRVEDHAVSSTEPLEPDEPVPGWGKNLWKLWRYRLFYILQQIKLGRNVFLVDVDTMWDRYIPLDVLFASTKEDKLVDAFFSQGTIFPEDVLDDWGFVMCMGTVAFRATPAAQTLLQFAADTCVDGVCDDQKAMNHALKYEYGVVWNKDSGLGYGVKGSGPGMPALGSNVQPDAKTNAYLAGEVIEPHLTVRMWPKPFVFRSFMDAVQEEKDPSTDQKCLGQVTLLGNRLLGQSNGVDFGQPFIVAPVLDKEGKDKVEAWEDFQKVCYVIDTPEFRQTRLPEPEKQSSA